jgi:prepilin-type processing-associated H-X9-DG protein
VVIGVIAVLIALLLPALQRARAHALKLQCLTQLRQFGLYVQMYENANKGAMIPYVIEDFSPTGYNGGYHWPQFLWEFSDYRTFDHSWPPFPSFAFGKGMLFCPARDPATDPPRGPSEPPSTPDGWWIYGHYHYSMTLFISCYWPGPPPLLTQGPAWPRVHFIRHSSDVIYISDGSGPGLLPWAGALPWYGHVKQANFLYVDGHCASLFPDAVNPPGQPLYPLMFEPWHGAGDPFLLGIPRELSP